MSKQDGKGYRPQSIMPQQSQQAPPTVVPSLLAAMKEGNEFGSICGFTQTGNLVPEMQKGIAEIEKIRGRPCICYLANMIKDVPETSISSVDELPFAEMVGQVPSGEKAVDIVIATPGGSAEQIGRFINVLRPRFDTVEFLIPDRVMSAGTVFALSGDRIWMDSRSSCLGPIDPQTPGKDGRYAPAQALLAFLEHIQKEGQAAINAGKQPAWSHVVLLREMDQLRLGAIQSASAYIKKVTAEYLAIYKFKSWLVHDSTGAPVTPDEKTKRADWVAGELAKHDRWKTHGHTIDRDVLWKDLRVQIDHMETVPGLQQAMRRFWALMYYAFDRGPLAKTFLSTQYVHVRSAPLAAMTKQGP